MRVTVLLVVAGLLCASQVWSAPPAAEEFNGPYASWKNVKTDYGAVGDGVADDTAALQHALDDLQFHKQFCVLYFPAGTYRITNTVRTSREGQGGEVGQGMTVIGEDPATTIIKWDGPAGGIMFNYDAWYSKISRLTLDGQGQAAVALGYGKAFSTYNETSDIVFKDVADGLVMGTSGAQGQAENEVLRCQFLRCSDKGIVTTNFNAMDIWAWYCRFEDCGYGMWNDAGNFHAYENLFLRSKKADIGTTNLMVFSFVNNTSIDSQEFLAFGPSGMSWGSPCSVTGNRILDPTGPWAIRLGNGGPYFVAGNVIKSRPGTVGPVVEMTWGNQTFVGNTYSVQNPVKEAGHFLRVNDDKIVAPQTIAGTLPVLPPTPPHRVRKVFEIAADADAAAIQAAIAAASKLKGQHPVVHIAQGSYKIAATLTIPAGCDIKLIGDGASENSTVLNWTGPDGGTLLHLTGPSVATVCDLSIQAPRGNDILVDNCDQPGGHIFTDELNAYGPNAQMSPVGVLVNGVEKSDVLMRCLQGASNCSTWVKVLGGTNRSAGRPAPGQVTVACGATSTAQALYAVAQGGRLVVRSVYHEVSGEAPTAVSLTGSGLMNIDATRFSYKTSAEHPLVSADNFRGSFALLTGLLLPVNSTVTARVDVTGDGSKTNLLVMDDLFWVNEQGVTADSVWSDTASPAAQAALLECNTNSGAKGVKGFTYLDDRGTADPQWIARMVQPTLDARLWTPAPAPAGVTNVQIDRVICTAGQAMVDLELRAGR